MIFKIQHKILQCLIKLYSIQLFLKADSSFSTYKNRKWPCLTGFVVLDKSEQTELMYCYNIFIKGKFELQGPAFFFHGWINRQDKRQSQLSFRGNLWGRKADVSKEEMLGRRFSHDNPIPEFVIMFRIIALSTELNNAWCSPSNHPLKKVIHFKFFIKREE